MEYMFANCLTITSINISFFELNKKNNLNFLFFNCSNLNDINLPLLVNNNLRNIYNMFKGCIKLASSKIKEIKFKQIKLNDICIIGLWYGHNYGSMLTYYALHEVVQNLGYSVLMINNPLGYYKRNFSNKYPKDMVESFYRISQQKNLKHLHEFNKECKSYLIGSDQLWNIYLSRPYKQFYFLGFANQFTKKLSYGTSFGKEYKGTEAEKNITKFNLKRFDAISVRDELSAKTIKKIFGISNVVQVCDPTLLLDSTNYIKLFNNLNINKSEDYFLAYILDPTPEIRSRLEQLSVDRNITVIILLGYSLTRREQNKKLLSLSGKGNIIYKYDINIKEWLYFYYNSKSVFTDSYHGTIFSIIFRKPFITLKNKKRGGERFISLLKPLKLINRLFETVDCINKRYDLYDKINYNLPIKRLSKIKENSFNWLKNQLDNYVK